MGRELKVVPADRAPWEDVAVVFGTRGAGRCLCQRYKLQRGESFAQSSPEVRAGRLRAQCSGGGPPAGLLAYLDGEPVGWCAVEPRPAYTGLVRVGRVPWVGRSEDPADASVWAVTCFVTRAGWRRQGVTHELARAAVPYARAGGARALEGYPITTKDVILEELHVGSVAAFVGAGFVEVSRPTSRRVVMRVDL